MNEAELASKAYRRQFRISELKSARDFHKAQIASIDKQLMEYAADKLMCHQPWECAGLGYCPREHACND